VARSPYNPKNRLPDDYMQTGLVAKTAMDAAEERRFFHWELEFPEVFFAPSKPGRQDVQLRGDGGFDVVVGNPPYVRPHNIEEEPKRYYQDVFETFTHKSDLLVCFLEITQHILRPSGYAGMITSDTWMFLDSFQNLRQMLLEHMTVTSLVPFDEKNVFEDAAVRPVVITYTYGDLGEKKISIRAVNKFHEFDTVSEVPHELYRNTYKNVFDLSLKGKVPGIKDKISEAGVPLGEITEIDFGLKTGDDKKFISFKRESDIDKPLIRGDDTYRYYIDFKGEYVHYDTEAMRRHRKTARPGESERFEEKKILVKDTSSIGFNYTFDNENYYAKDMLIVRKKKNANIPFELISVCGILNSTIIKWYYETTFPTVHVQHQELSFLPICRINFTTPAAERERLTQQVIGAYDIGDNAGVLQRVQTHIDADKTDVVHDLLAHLAQRMIDLNKQKQTEIKRFLSWVEKRLSIQPKNDGSTGIDSLTGKTIIQNYLGDYQKGEDELPWREFCYRLYQNRSRFAVSLNDVEGEIQREYEKSLETLIPIKHELARTDALIDKIVYRLYGLTDEEIELIERPQYEQALADAKSQVVADEKIKDDEDKIEKIAEGYLPAAKRFFDRVEPKFVEELLDSELPLWRTLPPDAPTFLITGDYNLHSLPDHMDFSTSVIPYTKAVETVLYERIFAPFRDSSGFTDADCSNKFLKDFMRGEKKLTLGNFMIILSSSKETALKTFVNHTIPDATNRVFGTNGVVTILNDEAMRNIRNKAAHDEVLSRNEAQEARAWAMQILQQV
jgi:hypothetical protein